MKRNRWSPLVIIACGHKKASGPAQARLLYTGTYAVACRQYGERLAREIDGWCVILSAKYGFVEPSRILEPYNVTLGDVDAISLELLRDQAAMLGLDRTVHVVGGQRYVDVVRQCWPHATRAIAERRGIGYQLAWLTERIQA